MIAMVIDASLQTPRAEGTTDINIETGFEEEGAEFADVDRLFNRGGENQGICTRMRMHERRVKSIFVTYENEL
jgi:hypothetical protein